jgi:hypothetical protein
MGSPAPCAMVGCMPSRRLISVAVNPLRPRSRNVAVVSTFVSVCDRSRRMPAIYGDAAGGPLRTVDCFPLVVAGFRAVLVTPPPAFATESKGSGLNDVVATTTRTRRHRCHNDAVGSSTTHLACIIRHISVCRAAPDDKVSQ